MRRRLPLALGSLLVALVVVELALRRWYPVGKPGYRLAPGLLHEPIPESRRIQLMPAQAGGGRIRVDLGPQGYRGPALERPKARTRLAVVGDSLVMAENVRYESSFPARLSAHLDGALEVVSIGASGYGPDQALLRVERDWRALDPDLVLLVLCATNDHGDLVRNKLFRFDQSGRLRRETPRISDGLRARFELAADWGDDPALVRLVRTWRLARGEEARLRREAVEPKDEIDLYLRTLEREWEVFEGGDPVVHHVMSDPYDVDLAARPDSAPARGKRALMAAVLAEWAESMRARRTPLLVLVVPSPVDLDPTFRIRIDPARFPEYDPYALTRSCREAAGTAGLPVYDLTELFEANDPATLFVGQVDIHWNAGGIELSAERVAGWIVEQGYR